MQSKKYFHWRVATYSLILLSFGLRLYLLDDIAIEKSEMTNIVWFIREGWITLLTHNKALNNHPLNSVLGYLTSALGYESLFTLRWHSVVLGVLGVAAIIRLGREWFGERDAGVAGLLIAVSSYHIGISQIARGYVGLVSLTTLGCFMGWRAAKTRRKRYWLGFTLASILNIYNHLYGAMAVGVIGVITLAFLMNRLSTRQPRPQFFKRSFWPLFASLMVIYVISFLLYWPMWADTVGVAGQDNKFKESDLRHTETYTVIETIGRPMIEAIRPFSLARDELRLRLGDPTLHYSAFDAAAILAENQIGFYLALISCGLGLIFSWLRFRRSTLICLAWLLLPFVAQIIGNLIMPGAYFRGRFFAFIYPPYLLLMARGWLSLADWLQRFVTGRWRLFFQWGVGWLGVAALVWLNLAWLVAYYAAARNENWAGVSHYLAQPAQANDIIYCGQHPDTACSFDLSVRLHRNIRELDDEFITLEEIQANRAHFEQFGRVWVVLPHLLPWQAAALKTKVEPTRYRLLGNAQYDQTGYVLFDVQPTLADNLTTALQLMAELSLNEEERYRNYANLTKIYLARDRLDAAEAAFASASVPLTGEARSGQQQDLAPLAERLEYALQSARLLEQIPSTATSSNLNFGGLARLVAYQIDRQTAAPGESIQVNLYWQPLGRIERNLISYVYLTDLEAKLRGEAKGIPGAGQFPTTSWKPGQLVIDAYTMFVTADTPTPLAVKVEAGLYDPQNYEFIKATNSTGQATLPTLTRLKIGPARPTSSPPSHQFKANFADLLSLSGYDLTTNPPGITFYWQAQTKIDTDYTVFIHLLNNQNQLVGQIDGQPFAGNYPTSWWSPGELIVDPRPWPKLPPGNYRVLVGWYNAANGSRLLLVDGSGDSDLVGDNISLTTVDLQ